MSGDSVSKTSHQCVLADVHKMRILGFGVKLDVGAG